MRLAASLRYAIYAALGVLLATGWARAPGAALLRLHGAAAMALLPLVGAAIALHVPRAWRERKNRLSGAILATTLLGLTATGYLLYYSGSDALRSAASWTHWACGWSVLLIVAVHVVLARRTRMVSARA
ncbi:MAG: hypothetical protein ACM30H_07375 [Clostridia bacterium]